MSILVESLKRQYKSGKITKDKIEEMKTNGKITAEESKYILGGK